MGYTILLSRFFLLLNQCIEYPFHSPPSHRIPYRRIPCSIAHRHITADVVEVVILPWTISRVSIGHILRRHPIYSLFPPSPRYQTRRSLYIFVIWCTNVFGLVCEFFKSLDGADIHHCRLDSSLAPDFTHIPNCVPCLAPNILSSDRHPPTRRRILVYIKGSRHGPHQHSLRMFFTKISQHEHVPWSSLFLLPDFIIT